MRTISDRINKDKSTVTALVHKLISHGYVVRVSCPSDSRVAYIELTKKGQDLSGVLSSISSDLMAEFFRPFSKKELYTMHELLTKINVLEAFK